MGFQVMINVPPSSLNLPSPPSLPRPLDTCTLLLLSSSCYSSQLSLLSSLLLGEKRQSTRVISLLKKLITFPAFARFLNQWVREKGVDLLSSSLSFLLDHPSLLDLTTKLAFIKGELEKVREEANRALPPSLPPSSGGGGWYGQWGGLWRGGREGGREDIEMIGGTRVFRFSRQNCWGELVKWCGGGREGGREGGLSPAEWLRRRCRFQFKEGVGEAGIGEGVEREMCHLLAKGMVEGGREGGRGGAALLEKASDEASYLPRLPLRRGGREGGREGGWYTVGCVVAHGM